MTTDPGDDQPAAAAPADLEQEVRGLPEKVLRALRIDAPLPPAGPARWATLAGLAVGGAVALLVVVFFVVVALGRGAG